MGRAAICSLTGAGLGVLAAVVAVGALNPLPHDRDAILVFVSIFLAGPGAIAGAIVGRGCERRAGGPGAEG